MAYKKLMIVIHTLEMGGAERCIAQLLRHLDRNLFRIDLVMVFDREVFYQIPGDVWTHILQHDSMPSVAAEHIDIPPELANSQDQFIWMETTGLKLAEVVRQRRPDIVLAQHYFSSVICSMSRKHWPTEVKLVCSAHNYASTMFARIIHGQLYNHWVRKYFNKADHIVAASEMVAKDMHENFGVEQGKITVIYNPVDVEEINRLSREPVEHPWFQGRSFPLIISVGRLYVSKGYNYLIRALALVHQQGTPARLALVGDGEERPRLEALAHELGLSPSVLFLGAQKNPFKFLVNADIFVMSSLWEGFGYVLVEALACGCPVVATNCLSGPA